ncbi:CoA transferase, partial [Streptomyces sp. NPDC060198]
VLPPRGATGHPYPAGRGARAEACVTRPASGPLPRHTERFPASPGRPGPHTPDGARDRDVSGLQKGHH